MGIVKFIGNVHFDDKITVGIELDRFSPNGNDGTTNVRCHFKCDKGKWFLFHSTLILQ